MRSFLRRAVAAAALGVCLVSVVAACSGDDDDEQAGSTETPATSPDTTESSSVPETPDDESGALGGSDLGFAIDIPDGWFQIDPSEDIAEALAEADLPDENVALIEAAVNQIASLPGSFFALDEQSIADGDAFAVNVNGYCAPDAGITSIDELRTAQEAGLAAVGGDNVELTETTLGDVSVLRTTYELSMGDTNVVGLQYAFITGEDTCFMTFSTDDPADLPRFEEMAATLRLN